jgi:hypothetical protein
VVEKEATEALAPFEALGIAIVRPGVFARAVALAVVSGEETRSPALHQLRNPMPPYMHIELKK